MALKKNNIVEKRNVLNEIRCNNMHLQELRFFTIYLSRINARNPEQTRLVRFPLSDFIAIMELKNVNIVELKQATRSLLSKVVDIPTESGGYEAFQLFKKCIVDKDKDTDQWFITIDAHDDALPLMFDFKRDYFTYELWNALRLTSSNQLRMYEILKQYQKQGERTIELEQLKRYLFIGENEYIRFGNFKAKVLEACKKALKENTDICFEYELIKKSRGKVSAIKFSISRNTEYRDQLSISNFIDLKSTGNDIEEIEDFEVSNDTVEIVDDEKTIVDDRMSFFSEALGEEFSLEQVELLYRLAFPLVDRKPHQYGLEISMYTYLSLKMTELNTKSNVNHRYSYLKKLIELDTQGV